MCTNFCEQVFLWTLVFVSFNYSRSRIIGSHSDLCLTFWTLENYHSNTFCIHISEGWLPTSLHFCQYLLSVLIVIIAMLICEKWYPLTSPYKSKPLMVLISQIKNKYCWIYFYISTDNSYIFGGNDYTKYCTIFYWVFYIIFYCLLDKNQEKLRVNGVYREKERKRHLQHYFTI